MDKLKLTEVANVKILWIFANIGTISIKIVRIYLNVGTNFIKILPIKAIIQNLTYL
jgi:hypothetical protein